MLVIPAIDLLGGSCVRLVQGKFDRSSVYSADPIETACRFIEAGAELIHVVDLDAARGTGNNRSLIRGIASLSCPIQVGGGIRTSADVEELLSFGVKRLIVGTVFIRDPDRVRSWTSSYRVGFAASLDVSVGKVRVSGWEGDGGLSAEEAAVLARETGMRGIVYTAISRDGTMRGPDYTGTAAAARISGLPVILSGGIGSMDDIAAAAEREREGIAGVITGKALYTGAIDLAEAVRRFRKNPAGGVTW